MSPSFVWGGVFVLSLWLGFAALKTATARGDQKPWTICWLGTLGAWLVVSLPPMVVLAFALAFDPPMVMLIVLWATAGALWWLGYRFGARLPIIGRWVGALEARELERAEKGIL